MRLKRETDYWELRTYAGRDPITARPMYVSRSFRGRGAQTIEGYRGIARGVAADRVGRRLLKDVGPKDFDDFYDGLRSRGLSAATVQRYHALLGGAFQQAMRWGWASRNVVRRSRHLRQ